MARRLLPKVPWPITRATSHNMRVVKRRENRSLAPLVKTWTAPKPKEPASRDAAGHKGSTRFTIANGKRWCNDWGMKFILGTLLAFSLCLPVFTGCQTAPTKPSEPPAKTKAQIESEKKAFTETKAKAEQGDAKAQNGLGWNYHHGQGVKQDYSKAIEWYTKAVEQNEPFAQLNLGRMYRYGEGVEQDYKKAVELISKAAEQGYDRAQHNLGHMYSDGEGVEQDFEKALEWNRKAAAQNDPQAQHNIGSAYEKGNGVKLDYAKALEWYHKAAEQGNAMGQNNLGRMYDKGEGVAQDYKKATEWFRKAAEQGDAWGQYNLGNMYEKGDGVHKDSLAAYAWYTIAARNLNTVTKENKPSAQAKAGKPRIAKEMTPEQITKAEALAKQLQKEIEAKKSGK